MCAIEAGKRGRRVALLEHAERIGKKILISGGGRCNFTNIYCRPENFISANRTSRNPRWLVIRLRTSSRWSKNIASPITKKRLASFSATARRRHHGHARSGMPGGRRADFSELQDPRGSARRPSSSFDTEAAEFRAPALVVATGGLSIPKMGATAFGYDLARQFGLKISQTKPGLVPSLLGGKDRQACIAIWRAFRPM